MSKVTTSLVSARLPACLVTIVIDYFGRTPYIIKMGKFGQYEDCQKYLLSCEPSPFTANIIMYGACVGGYMSIIELAITYGASDWNNGLWSACKGGQVGVIEFMISRGACDFNEGMSGACKKGHLNAVKLMTDKGADNWDDALYNACYRGHLDIIKYMTDRGLANLDRGLAIACWRGHRDITEIMIAHGADRCNHCDRPIDEHIRSL